MFYYFDLAWTEKQSCSLTKCCYLAGRREIFSAAIFQHVIIFSVDGNKQAEEDAMNNNQSQGIIRFLLKNDVS